jgi:hypothetical protein
MTPLVICAFDAESKETWALPMTGRIQPAPMITRINARRHVGYLICTILTPIQKPTSLLQKWAWCNLWHGCGSTGKIKNIRYHHKKYRAAGQGWGALFCRQGHG